MVHGLKAEDTLKYKQSVNTGWKRTVHVSRCTALYSGRIVVPLCREVIILCFKIIKCGSFNLALIVR